jgi:Mg-chelatase subunit ChlD
MTLSSASTHRGLLAAAAVFALALAGAPGIGSARAADATQLLLTADTEGRLRACAACPGGVDGVGDLSRRASAVAKLRAANPATLLLDAGNALVGTDSIASTGRVTIAAYNALGYDAVNVSYRDFRFGKAQSMAAWKGASFPVLSANLLDEANGQPLFQPYAVKTAGGRRIAVVGLTELTASMAALPHMRQQLAGVKVGSPLDALATCLPKAKAESDAVVLLYYGSASGLAGVLEKFGGSLAAILVGGVGPESLPAGDTTPLAGASEHGRSIGVVTLNAGKTAVSQCPVDSTVPAEPAMQTWLAAYAEPRGLVALAPAAEQPAVGALTKEGKTLRIGASAHNNGVELRVGQMSVADQLGDVKPSAGGKLLVLKTEWENIFPLTMVDGRPTPTMYKVLRLSDHLYVVANGRLLARLHMGAAEMEGLVPEALNLEKLGSTLSGDVVFDLPAADLHSLELRFYDFAHGNFSLPLLAPEQPAAPETAVAPLQKNAVVEGGVFGMKKLKTYAGRSAGDGKMLAVVDLRARSQLMIEADARTYDSGAKAGTKTKVGTVADWKEARKYLQLVADGEYAYSPLPESDLAAEPRFLPDLMTGGTLVFEIPADAQSLELRCDFPNSDAQDEQAKHPAPLVFALEGKRPALPERKAIVSMDDEMFKVAVTAQATASEFAGLKAEDDRQFLILDVTVANAGKSGEFFQTRAQLQYATEAGASVEMHEASTRPLHPAADIVWVPGGEQRSFQVAYAIPAQDKRPRLLFSGAAAGQTLALPRLAGAADAAPSEEKPMAAAEAAPAEKPTPAPQLADAKVNQPEPKPRSEPAPTPKPPVAAGEATSPPPPAAATPTAPRIPKGLAGVGLTAQAVNAAIDRGADFLWKYLKKEGVDSEGRFDNDRENALACLALVHANAHERMPDFDATLRRYLAEIPVHGQTYIDGLVCMLVEAYGNPAFRPKLREVAAYLVEAQGAGGSWGYGASVQAEAPAAEVQRRVLTVSGGIPLDAPRTSESLTRRSKPSRDHDGDNSTTQYALLGLHAASRAGLKPPAATWQQALVSQRARQGKDGGFAYHNSGQGYGSMTCAGICALALCRHELGEKDPADDPGIARGLAWLDKNFSVTENPGSTDWLFYYLYSVERVGRILNTEFIGDHEWYPLGARQLVDGQNSDGSWKGPSSEADDPRLATSFALLFLTRATAALQEDLKRGGQGKLQTSCVAPALRVYIILDASGSMLAEMGGEQKFDVARRAVTDVIRELPDNSDVALRVYGHRKRAIEPGADEDTELLVRMGKLNKDALLPTLNKLRARGKTPLSLSLKEAVDDLQGVTEDAPVTLVLLTDGGEDTMARLDPVKAAAAVGELKGVRFTVVGFDVAGREDWSRQLQGMAQAGRGQYIPAANAEALRREVRGAVLGQPEGFAIMDGSGAQVAAGLWGQTVKLPEGRYTMRTIYAGSVFTEHFWINTERTTSVNFDVRNVAAEQASGAAVPAPAPAPAVAAPTPAPADQPAPPKAKFCSSCGSPVKPGAKFCSGCGAPLK